MRTVLEVGGLAVEVVRKDIRNVHLSVHPPTGRVTLAAPARLGLETLRAFAISKLGWIRQQQQKLREQERETPREFLERESHYVWGRRRLLKLIEEEGVPSVELSAGRIILHIRPGTGITAKRALLDGWYRAQVKAALPALVSKWEPILGVKVERCFVQRMKTQWGSCHPEARSIRLNTDLARKPPECLEYIVVHEMVHLLEPTHNERFQALMDRFLPTWASRRDALNRLPVRHESWSY